MKRIITILLLISTGIFSTACFENNEIPNAGRVNIIGEWEVTETIEEFYGGDLYYEAQTKFFTDFYSDGTGILPNPVSGLPEMEWIYQTSPEVIAIFQANVDMTESVLRFNIIDNQRERQIWQRVEFYTTNLGELELVTTWEMYKVR